MGIPLTNLMRGRMKMFVEIRKKTSGGRRCEVCLVVDSLRFVRAELLSDKK